MTADPEAAVALPAPQAHADDMPQPYPESGRADSHRPTAHKGKPPAAAGR
ncbi:hypothetical protein [Nocardia sp. NBC_00416]